MVTRWGPLIVLLLNALVGPSLAAIPWMYVLIYVCMDYFFQFGLRLMTFIGANCIFKVKDVFVVKAEERMGIN